MVAEVTPNYDSQWAAIGAVAQKLGVGAPTPITTWVGCAGESSRSALC
jgi:transposase